MLLPHIHHLGPDTGVAKLKSVKHHHQPVDGESQSNKLSSQAHHAINTELVYIDHIGYVPGSVDGMTNLLKAKSHFNSSGFYNNLEGSKAVRQMRVDELKMFKNVSNAEAIDIVDKLGNSA